MHLAKITVNGFRNLNGFALQLHPGLNVILGENNIGKTNLIDNVRLALTTSYGTEGVRLTPADVARPQRTKTIAVSLWFDILRVLKNPPKVSLFVHGLYTEFAHFRPVKAMWGTAVLRMMKPSGIPTATRPSSPVLQDSVLHSGHPQRLHSSPQSTQERESASTSVPHCDFAFRSDADAAVRYLCENMSKRRRTPQQIMLNDHDRLALFVHRLEELKKRRYYDRFGKQITREESDALLMDDDALAAYMLSFRHFHATGSPIFIGRIHKILSSWSRIANDEETATQLRDIRSNRGGSVIVEVHDLEKRPVREIKEDELFDLYLNGHFFHTDEHALQFFYQLPHAALTQAKVAFQFILGKRTSRILAYYPLVLKALASKKLKPGVFTTEILHAGEEPDSPSTRTFPLDGI